MRTRARRNVLRGARTATLLGSWLAACATRLARPNIIFILADDLGYAELGSYGQDRIRTPNIDRLAREGMRFTQHYSGSPVCAPSRYVLLTGLHTGHAYIRGNDEMPERGDVWHDLSLEGQRPIPEGTYTVGRMLQAAGYTTAAIGKWGLGGPASSGEPNRQGFDFWFGYLDQRMAHNHYPIHLWRNRDKVTLSGNPYFFPHQRLPEGVDPNDPASYAPYRGTQYSQDLMIEEALKFISANRERPFFLYLAFTVPHAALQVPDESLREYQGAFPETPYLGDRGYLPHPTPRAAYAAMVTRMDREVGRVMSLLTQLELDGRTAVFFSSDNGPTFNGGTDSEFFRSAGRLRGLKTELYEGGIRVPLIARWPRRIPAGSVTDRVSAFWDLLPTFAALAGTSVTRSIDGLSLVPTLLGRPEAQQAHEYLYWEHAGEQAVRLNQWKAVRHGVERPIEIFDLGHDVGESTDLAARHPDLVARIDAIMQSARTESTLFPLAGKR